LSVASCQWPVKALNPVASCWFLVANHEQRTTSDQRLTALPEKFLHHLRRTSGQYAAPDVHLMIQTGVIHHLQNRMDGACLRVVGTVHQAADAGMHCRSRAHGARLNCSKQFAVPESVVTEVSSRLAQRHDFSMSGWIGVGEVAIPSSSNHAPFAHHDRSHRHFTRFQCALGAAEGFFHPEFVGPEFVGAKFVRGEQLSVTSGGLPEASSQFSVPRSESGPAD